MMRKERTYSRYGLEATQLLGKQVKLGRKQNKWSEVELAERAGISRGTLQKIERGDPGCAIGLVFEVVALVGVPLFNEDEDEGGLSRQHERMDDKLAVLPKSIHKRRKAVVDDF